MIDRATAEALAKERLSRARFAHSCRVAREALLLARRFNGVPASAEVAGLLHDYCRELTAPEMLKAAERYGIPLGPLQRWRPVCLLHGPVAAAELSTLGLEPEIAQAIALHTTGAGGMSILEKCLYLADFIEPGRSFSGLREVRSLAERSLNEAVAAAVRMSLLDLIGRGRGVLPGALDLYNELHVNA